MPIQKQKTKKVEVDINAYFAKHIMGWDTDRFPKPEPGDHFSARGDIFRYGLTERYYVNEDGDTIIKVEDWKPATDINQLLSCLDVLNKKEYQIKMGNESGKNGTNDWWCDIDRVTAHNARLHFAILDTICKLFKIKR